MVRITDRAVRLGLGRGMFFGILIIGSQKLLREKPSGLIHIHNGTVLRLPIVGNQQTNISPDL